MEIQNVNLEEKDKKRLEKLALNKGIQPAVVARLLILQGMERIEKDGGRWVF